MKKTIKRISAAVMALTLLGTGTAISKTIAPKTDNTLTASAAIKTYYSLDGSLKYLATLYSVVGKSADVNKVLALETCRTTAIAEAEYVFTKLYSHPCDDIFVRDLYKGILGRSASIVEVDYYTSQIRKGGSRRDVLNLFLYSVEFFNRCNNLRIPRG